MVNTAKLQRYSLFGGLTVDQLDLVRPFLTFRDCAENQFVLHEGDPNGTLFFILEGSVKIVKDEQILIEMNEGDTFGEVELLDIMPAVASVIATKSCHLALLSNHCLHSLFKNHPEIFAMIIMNLARDLARRLRRMDEMLIHRDFCD